MTPKWPILGNLTPSLSVAIALSDIERAAGRLGRAEEDTSGHSEAFRVAWWHLRHLRRAMERLAARLSCDQDGQAPSGRTRLARGREQASNKPSGATIPPRTRPDTHLADRSASSEAGNEPQTN